MPQSHLSRRPRLTLKTALFAGLDAAGMVLFASGVLWLARSTPLFFSTFPGNDFEAWLATVAGLALMVYGAAGLLRTSVQQLPVDVGEQVRR